MLDRPIGDAPIAVQPVGLGKRTRGTGVEAQRAISTKVFEGLLGLKTTQIQREKQLAEQEPRPALRMQQHRVLSHRPQTGAGRQLALQHGTGIHIAARLAVRKRLADPSLQVP